MNRGLAIAGGVMLALAIIVPLSLAEAAGGGFEEAILFIFIIGPIAGLIGLTGLILLIVGLATGGGRQQQQQVVIVTGGQYCHGCGQPKAGGAFCAFCGVRA